MSKDVDVTKVQELLKKISELEQENKDQNGKKETIKRKYLLNIIMINYFLSKEELTLFINYLDEEKISKRLSSLYKLKDIYLLNNIKNYQKKKEIINEVVQKIAKENNISLDLRKNKKVLRQHLELEKYQQLKEKVSIANLEYKKSKLILKYINKLIKIEKKQEEMNKQSKEQENIKQLKDFTDYFTYQTNLNQKLSDLLNELCYGLYLKKYGEGLNHFIPEDITKIFKEINKLPEFAKEEVCLLGKDVLKNYLRTLPKENTTEKNFIKKIIHLFEENLPLEVKNNTLDTSSYYNILSYLSEDDKNYSIIEKLILQIDNFKYARQDNHILFYLLDKFIQNYKVKLVNQGIQYTDPSFYKEIIKLIFNQTNPLSEIEIEQFLDKISDFINYCKKRKYISLSEVNEDISEIISSLHQEKAEKEESNILEQENILKNVAVPNLVNYYQRSSKELVKENTFMFNKRKNTAFSISCDENGTITFTTHLLDNSKLLSFESELLSHQDKLIKLEKETTYPVLSFSYSLTKDNVLLPLKITSSLVNINEVFSEKDIQTNPQNPILKDSISILQKLNNTSEEITTVSSFFQLIDYVLCSNIKEIFQKNNIPFIYQEEITDKSLTHRNHNQICQVLSEIDKEEAHTIFNIIDENKDKYYTMKNNTTSTIELNPDTSLGIYLLSTIHKIKEGTYSQEEAIKTISYLLEKLNKTNYTPYQVRNENNKELRKVLKPQN